MTENIPIDDMYFRVVKVHTFAGSQSLTNATGFFFLHDCFIYLITSRHVVITPYPIPLFKEPLPALFSRQRTDSVQSSPIGH